tara:strand:+ start:7413 stop:7688 length:276 start_codon:yes stop_codon:yes gene_type:complete
VTAEKAAMLVELNRHARTNLTAGWAGSPDPSNPSNIRRVCSCGQVIGQLPYPTAKPGRTVHFRLGGEEFDLPHREHIAEVLAAPATKDGAQ